VVCYSAIIIEGIAYQKKRATRHVRATNLCLIGLSCDRVANRAILVSALDNLVKGASGQAIQNMNAMLGIPETSALEHRALFP